MSTPGVANNDLAEQLTKVAKLHADGMLTDEEFATLKLRLLATVNSKPTSAHEGGNGRDRESTRDISDFAAWCLAFVPVIAMFVYVAFNIQPANGGGALATIYLVPLVLWILFLLIDRDIVQKAGGEVGSLCDDVVGIVLLAAVAVPRYLYVRSNSLGKTLTIFYVSVTLLVGWILLLFLKP